MNLTPTTCSDSGCKRGIRKLAMVLLHKWPRRFLLLTKWKSDPGSGSGFSKCLTPVPKKKRRILPDSTPALWIRGHLWTHTFCFLKFVNSQSFPKWQSRGAHGSGVPESTPAGFCDFLSDPEPGRSQNFVKNQTWCQAKFLTSEIFDFTLCMHAQSNILHSKYADRNDY